MVDPALEDPVAPARWTAERYLRLVDEGMLSPDDRVELLEGVDRIVSSTSTVPAAVPSLRQSSQPIVGVTARKNSGSTSARRAVAGRGAVAAPELSACERIAGALVPRTFCVTAAGGATATRESARSRRRS